MNSSATVSDKTSAWERFRKSRYSYHGARWLPLAALALLTYALFPVAAGQPVLVPEVGDVSTEEVVAPFEFDVFKTEADRQQEGDELAAQVVPIYEYRSGISDSIVATSVGSLPRWTVPIPRQRYLISLDVWIYRSLRQKRCTLRTPRCAVRFTVPSCV